MGSVLAADVTEFVDPSRKSGLSGSSREIPPLLFLQEVLLKRAADLVEALYGMPHNNQVGDGSLTHRPPPPPPTPHPRQGDHDLGWPAGLGPAWASWAHVASRASHGGSLCPPVRALPLRIRVENYQSVPATQSRGAFSRKNRVTARPVDSVVGRPGLLGLGGPWGTETRGELPSGRGPVPLTPNPVPSVLPWPRASLRGLCAVGAGGTDGVLKCSPEGGSFPIKKYVLSQSGPSDGGVPLRVPSRARWRALGLCPRGRLWAGGRGPAWPGCDGRLRPRKSS